MLLGTVEDISSRIDALIGYLQALQSDIDVGDTGRRDLLSLLLKFFHSISRKVKDEKQADWVPICKKVILKYTPYFPVVQSPPSQNISIILSPFYNRLAAEISPGTCVVLHPHSLSKIEQKANILDEIKKDGKLLKIAFWGKILAAHAKNILVMRFPNIEGVLISPVLAHELGHFLLNQKSDITEKFTAFIQSNSRETDRERTINWLKELFCDFFGFKLFGPAFYWALKELLLVNEDLLYSKGPSLQEYPHPALRLHLQAKMAIAFLNKIKVSEPDNVELLTNTTIQTSEFIKQVEKILPPNDEVVPLIQTLSESFTAINEQYFYREDILECEFEQLIHNLRNGIPPVEIMLDNHDTVPADWRSIVNVAWIKNLEEKGKYRKPLEDVIACSLDANHSAQNFREEKERWAKK